ncbi:diguanylate cyclase [Alteromonas flava]|uniref:tetratricopeptide repeat-containing diguanylate cyclase n=1 Tax=Alteromonas flava TaxID=2048003 RepID=UPI000C285F4F|nr:diguanylate cyclase [Alteromonas flava]
MCRTAHPFRLLLGLSLAITLTCGTCRAASVEEVQQARANGDIALADDLAQQLLTQSKQMNDLQIQADAQYQLGRNAMERNVYPDAQHWLQAAQTLYQDLDNLTSLAHTYRQLGLTYRYQSNYSVALEYLYLALAIFQQNDSERELASVHNSIGVVLEKMGQFNEAATYHQQALEANYRLNDQAGIASALYNLGDIRRIMGDLALALDYFQQALALDEASGNRKDIAYSSYKIGYVSMQMGDFTQAREFMQRAYDLFVQIEAQRDIDWARSGLAELSLLEGNVEQAATLADTLIGNAKSNNYNSLLLDLYLLKIEILTAQQAYADALLLIDEALPFAQSIDESHKVSQLLALKVTVSEQQSDIALAYSALKRQKALDDNLFNQKRLDAIASTQAQTEFVRRANQIALLEQQQALAQVQAQQRSEQRQFMLAGVIAALTIGFLAYSRMMQTRYTRKLESEVKSRTADLQAANEELAALSLTDKLTGLKNRRFFEHQITADIQSVLRKHQSVRNQSKAPIEADLCLFVIDIDNFKAVNDTYGHVAGDRVLQQTAHRVQGVFRASDYVVRWGGEEFVAAARFIERTKAEDIANRLIHDMQRQPFEIDQATQQTLTCSIGFVCFPFKHSDSVSNDSTMRDLFSIADSCLYAAKSSGRNTWVGITDVASNPKLPLPASMDGLKALAAKDLITLVVAEREAGNSSTTQV